MGVCVRVRVARVVRVSEGTLPTIVNTLRSSKEPLGTIRRNPNYPPPGLVSVEGGCANVPDRWLFSLYVCIRSEGLRSQAKISSAGSGGVSVCMPGCKRDGHQPVLAIGQWRVYFSYGGSTHGACIHCSAKVKAEIRGLY